MISAFIELALSQRVVVIGLSLVLLIAGLFAFSELDIEAYPDPVQPMVEVLTLPNGLSAEEVERLVTVPLEFGLAGMRDLECDALDLAVRALRYTLLLRLGQRLLSGPHGDHQPARNGLRCRKAFARAFRPKIRSARSTVIPSRARITI